MSDKDLYQHIWLNNLKMTAWKSGGSYTMADEIGDRWDRRSGAACERNRAHDESHPDTHTAGRDKQETEEVEKLWSPSRDT